MLVTEQRSSGLVVAREGWDEVAASAALKQLDRRLVLQKHPRDGVEGGWVYKVVCVVSDTLAPVIFTWMDANGNPLPLSSALVDEVQSLMLGARNKPADEDEHNARLAESRRRDAEREHQAVLDDHRAYIDRSRVSVSLTSRKAGRRG